MYAQQGLLDELEADLDRVNRSDPSALTPAEVEEAVMVLDRVEAKLAATKARLHRRYDIDREWAVKGAQHPGAVVAKQRRVPSKSCRRPFTVARKLEELPALLDALARGTISVQHRDRILGIDSPRVHEDFLADHGQFVEWAETLDWRAFDTALVLWLHYRDPDGPDPGDERRGLDLSQTWRDEFVLTGRLGAIKGTVVATEIKRLYDQLFQHDWKAAKERLGRDPHDHELGRTARQRRADALALMAERSAVEPDQVRKGVILACVLIGGEAFRWLCETTTGVKLRPGQIAPHVDDLMFETILYGDGMRDVSVSKQRFFVEALRRAAQAKGRQCFHQFCDRPAAECQVDHEKPASKGGATAIWNSQLGCPFHNRAKSDHDPGDPP